MGLPNLPRSPPNGLMLRLRRAPDQHLASPPMNLLKQASQWAPSLPNSNLPTTARMSALPCETPPAHVAVGQGTPMVLAAYAPTVAPAAIRAVRSSAFALFK
jgi:hypothetical protein